MHKSKVETPEGELGGKKYEEIVMRNLKGEQHYHLNNELKVLYARQLVDQRQATTFSNKELKKVTDLASTPELKNVTTHVNKIFSLEVYIMTSSLIVISK